MRLGLLAIATTVLLGSTTGWAAAPRAAAAATCGGRLLASIPIKNKGTRIGSLVIYRSGGTTCAMTKHGGASWGKKRFTSIMLVGCKTRKAGRDCGEAPYKQDKGQFAYQAGPVRVNSGRRCIWARADLGAAGNKPIITRQTSSKYLGRYCG